MKKILTLLTTFILSLFLVSCNNNYKYVEGKVNIVATTTMLGDLAKEVGGDKVSVTTLMGVGVDPHLYSAKASDTNALTKSDFIIYGGLHLEGKMVDVLEKLSEKKPYLNSGEVVHQKKGVLLHDDKGNIDPHIWFNLNNWILVTQGLVENLSNYDSENASYYESRGNNYIEQLKQLDLWIKEKVSELELKDRILVTAHDAFQYFANAYDFTVESIQGISTDSEASIADINNLVNLVIEKNVKAIFIENSIPHKTIESVIAAAKSKNHELIIGGELYADSLGNNEHSNFINAYKHNVETIVEALKK